MTRLEELDHEKRSWSVEEAADFLGFSRNYVYELIHANKIDGWFVGDKGGYRFCPAKLKIWMEKRFGIDGRKQPRPNGGSVGKSGRSGEVA